MSAGLDMKVQLAAQVWFGTAFFLLTAMSAASAQDSSTHSRGDIVDIQSLLSNETLDNSSIEIPDDWLEREDPCAQYPSLEDFFSQYTPFPSTLITVARHDACENLKFSGLDVELEDYFDLYPQWLDDATMAGECPWQLVRREFLRGTLPPAILEVSCLCNGHRCSLHGDFRCTSVTRLVKVWSSGEPDSLHYRPHLLHVTAACVCAQRHAPQGSYAQPYEQH